MTIDTTSPEFKAIIDTVRVTTIAECKKEFKPQEWVSIKTACEKLDISRGLLIKIIANNKIKAKHIGKSVRISISSIEKYMDNETESI